MDRNARNSTLYRINGIASSAKAFAALAGQTDQACALLEEEALLLQRYPDDPTIPGMLAHAFGSREGFIGSAVEASRRPNASHFAMLLAMAGKEVLNRITSA